MNRTHRGDGNFTIKDVLISNSSNGSFVHGVNPSEPFRHRNTAPIYQHLASNLFRHCGGTIKLRQETSLQSHLRIGQLLFIDLGAITYELKQDLVRDVIELRSLTDGINTEQPCISVCRY